MDFENDTIQFSMTRRRFLEISAMLTLATTLGCDGGRKLHLQQSTRGPRTTPKLENWQDLYRQRWTWDAVAHGSHGWANCRSACAWNIYVKNGVVVREEQTATYEQSESGVPDFNPRGCQKGACYSDLMYGPSRVTVPMKRVGPRGGGRWEKISWEQAIREIAEQMVDIVAEYGPDTIYQDLGPNFDHGATTLGRFRFQMQSGGMFADMWAEIGDLNIGGTLTLGFAHAGGSSDEWFLSDYLVVWMMNPSVTQISDAHFLFEARYQGAELVVIDPQYSATTVHADQWLPLRTGTDAALALATARHIWDSGAIDLAYVREQTDLPYLVCLDTQRFLRDSDLRNDGNEDLLQIWNSKTKRPAPAPGCEGSDIAILSVTEFEPPIEGKFKVTRKDGREIEVATVGTILREQLAHWTFAEASRVTGLSTELIEKFADGFAKAQRPMVFSSWGSNRFIHSDLMNRAKLLCLALKGAMGKRGAGYQSTGFFDMAGFASEIQTQRPGLRGKLEMMMGMMTPKEMFETVVDIAKRRKGLEHVIMDQTERGEKKFVCATNVSTLDYNHQGIAESLDREVEGLYPRPLAAYHQEANEKGWQNPLPTKGTPRVFLTGGSNLLRRSNQTQRMLEVMWPAMKLVVAIDQKMCFTAMHSDYFLPAAGWYEKPGIKYTMSYVPYLHYCDAAITPLGDSKDEWEIYWLLTREIERIAKERNLPVLDACGKFAVDWKDLHQRYSFHGEYGPKDAERVTQRIIDNSPAVAGAKIEDLKETGITKFKMTGPTLAPSFLFNPDWKGKGVLSTMTYFTERKWHWPTYTGRIQFYLDHPWFIEGGEALPVHKESVKAGGDLPFQMVSCHSRWSIHSTWRDLPLLLRLQRGEPCMYLNPKDAQQLQIADGGWSQIYNRYGATLMRVKYSTMVRPGVAFYFHAWEPHQFPNHESYKWLIPGVMKPLHMAGGQGHLHFGINHLQSGAFVQDTRIGIRPWHGDPEQMSPSSVWRAKMEASGLTPDQYFAKEA